MNRNGIINDILCYDDDACEENVKKLEEMKEKGHVNLSILYSIKHKIYCKKLYLNEYRFILKDENTLKRYTEKKTINNNISLKEMKSKIIKLKHVSKIHNV